MKTIKSGFFGLVLFMTICGFANADQFPIVVEAKVRAVISAEREGVLSELSVDAGDRIKKGNILAVVYHKDLVLRKEQGEARRDYLQVQVENLKSLNEKGLTTDEELAKARMEQAVNEVQIRMIEEEIARSRIIAPFSGIIVGRHTQSHEWVKPGQPVVEMYNSDELRVVADIPSEIAVKMKPGQSEKLFFPDMKKEFPATLSVIFPQVDVRSNTVKVHWRVGAKDQANLKPGMKGFLTFGTN